MGSLKILGLIPARGGSKRIPRKNLRPLAGQPLVVWTIGCAAQCLMKGVLDRLVLSSEDPEILDLAEQYGVEAIERPKDLAQDTTPMYPVIHHALEAVGEDFDYLCLLHPTSPFRLPEDIEACVYSACWGDYPACASAEEDMAVPNGAVYVGATDWLRDGGNFDGLAVQRTWMPKDRSLDLDTLHDWEEAVELMRLLGHHEGGWRPLHHYAQ